MSNDEGEHKTSLQQMRFIFTADPDAAPSALNEIAKAGIPCRLIRWLDAGVGYMQADIDFSLIARMLRDHPPVFIRHICPVAIVVALDGEQTDLAKMRTVGTELQGLLNPKQSFSVQTRLLGMKAYRAYDVNHALAEPLSAGGSPLDVKEPAQVVSVVCTPHEALIGVSSVVDNLSDWAGGVRRFQRDESLISRAEFKLLEAIEVFHLVLPESGIALDMGAAPGGWTRVLRQRNLTVMAVDPAELSPQLMNDEGVQHFREPAQLFLLRDWTYDVIVNDMKMGIQDSVALMGQAAGRLNGTSGIAVMTLKLPSSGQQRLVSVALSKLEQWYHVLGARQLFHNRNEVTVALQPKRGFVDNQD